MISVVKILPLKAIDEVFAMSQLKKFYSSKSKIYSEHAALDVKKINKFYNSSLNRNLNQ